MDGSADLMLALRCMDMEERAVRSNRILEVARAVHEELQAASWVQSQNFIRQHLKEDHHLKLVGPGDPSGTGSGFCFLRSDVKRSGAGEHAGKNAARSKKGTPFDMRGMSNAKLVEVLLNMGMPYESIQSLRRWERVSAIKVLAKRGRGDRKYRDLYASDTRGTLTEESHKYKNHIRSIWDSQRKELSVSEESERGIDAKVMRAYDNDGSNDQDAMEEGGNAKEKRKATTTTTTTMTTTTTTTTTTRREEVTMKMRMPQMLTVATTMDF